MNARRSSIITLAVILIVTIFTGVANALDLQPKPVSRAILSNVRDYSPAYTAISAHYAVDGGVLFVGSPSGWLLVITPKNVIASAVAADSKDPNTIYIGAANEIAIYQSRDAGKTWLRIPLTAEYVGGVTDIAVDSVQRLVYVGTDTAGVFRLRDVGSRLILTGQLLLNEPVLEVAADNAGSGMAFARTQYNLYRAENYGLTWLTVDNLHSVPTAVAIANTTPASVYVGTVGRGVLTSQDGLTWNMANDGLGLVPGSRLQVDALVVDPVQPDVMYVATSFLNGTTEVHQAPAGVWMSVDGGEAWANIVKDSQMAVADLLPVSGSTGSVFALTTDSRMPLALGNAPALAAATAEPVAVTQTGLTSNIAVSLSWIVAALAALALAFAVISDLRSRQPVAPQRSRMVRAVARSSSNGFWIKTPAPLGRGGKIARMADAGTAISKTTPA